MGKLSPEERRAVENLAKASARLVRVARSGLRQRTHAQLAAEVEKLSARLGEDLLGGRDPRAATSEELRDVLAELKASDKRRRGAAGGQARRQG